MNETGDRIPEGAEGIVAPTNEKQIVDLGIENPVNTSSYSEEQIRQFRNEISFYLHSGYGTETAPTVEKTVLENRNLRQQLGRYLEGKHLVDLGCGGRQITTVRGLAPMTHLAQELGCKSYTGVDLDRDMIDWVSSEENTAEEGESKFFEKESEKYGLKINYVYDEILHFLHSLPDNSACFVMNAIDTDVMEPRESHTSLHNTKYYAALNSEIARTLAEGGIMFGFYNEAVDKKYLEKNGLRLLNHPDLVSGPFGFYCLSKESSSSVDNRSSVDAAAESKPEEELPRDDSTPDNG